MVEEVAEFGIARRSQPKRLRQHGEPSGVVDTSSSKCLEELNVFPPAGLLVFSNLLTGGVKYDTISNRRREYPADLVD